MPCLLAGVGAIFPRAALVAMWVIGYGGAAFATVLIPVLGFFFMPFTTCFYAIAHNEFGGVHGLGMVLFILGVLLDFGSWGHGAHSGYRYRRTRYVVRR